MNKEKMVSIPVSLASTLAEDLTDHLNRGTTEMTKDHLNDLQTAIKLGIRPRFDIYGRRWFQKSYGNTYHTVSIEKDGVELMKLPSQYGYGDHYQTRAIQWLVAAGHLPEKKGAPSWQYRDDHDLHFHVTDVERQRDL